MDARVTYGMFEDSGELLIETWFKEVIRVARERTVKYPPKRGKLTRSQVKRAVEKVVHGRHDKEAEHRAETAVVETIKRANKKK